MPVWQARLVLKTSSSCTLMNLLSYSLYSKIISLPFCRVSSNTFFLRSFCGMVNVSIWQILAKSCSVANSTSLGLLYGLGCTWQTLGRVQYCLYVQPLVHTPHPDWHGTWWSYHGLLCKHWSAGESYGGTATLSVIDEDIIAIGNRRNYPIKIN